MKPTLELSPRSEVRLEYRGTPGIRLTLLLSVRPKHDTSVRPVPSAYLYLPLHLLAARLK